MNDLELCNAIIQSAEISNDDHDVLTAWISLYYGDSCQRGSGQCFGGYALYLPVGFENHDLESFAGHFIYRIMEIAGVSKWSDLEGKSVRVRHNDSHVYEIGHIIKNDWFCPEKDFEAIIQRRKRTDVSE